MQVCLKIVSDLQVTNKISKRQTSQTISNLCVIPDHKGEGGFKQARKHRSVEGLADPVSVSCQRPCRRLPLQA